MFGLGAGVITKDISRAIRMADALDAGTVYVNCYSKQESIKDIHLNFVYILMSIQHQFLAAFLAATDSFSKMCLTALLPLVASSRAALAGSWARTACTSI